MLVDPIVEIGDCVGTEFKVLSVTPDNRHGVGEQLDEFTRFHLLGKTGVENVREPSKILTWMYTKLQKDGGVRDGVIESGSRHGDDDEEDKEVLETSE